MLAGMKRGSTLLEVLVVLAIAGVVALIGLLPIGALHDRLAVDQVTEALTSAHTRARLVAMAERRIAVLTLTADSVVLRVVESAADTVIRWRGMGPAAEGVTAAGVPRQIFFGPSGVTIGVANGSYLLTRGSARRQIIVSRYGRVRVI
jgi:prepilin-type N-terminal cleavage/methylation domain-containing protein